MQVIIDGKKYTATTKSIVFRTYREIYNEDLYTILIDRLLKYPEFLESNKPLYELFGTELLERMVVASLHVKHKKVGKGFVDGVEHYAHVMDAGIAIGDVLLASIIPTVDTDDDEEKEESDTKKN